ncbi:sulfotransferase domain-containing protein [Pelagicoccus mobilis]|uniref:Sulfotransferase domain-containing protein n=1 Tax=Pelagicoccus mobilis TaxID=415221 RepID=A0A934RV15_9BACT|nr:sulfotransferase domain-containing protein [Pelagicoccus mobilis]MBK1875654.1 sulfotransferase domain-containing protein [Pelagicoccus mobilis]
MGRIYWLTSYPKSGNTWFRAFLECLLGEDGEDLDLNALERVPSASDRMVLDRELGYESGDLSFEELERVLPEAFASVARKSRGAVFQKLHDSFRRNEGEVPLYSHEAVEGALYFIRNPLDVCVSYACHRSELTLDEVIRLMGDASHGLAATRWRQQLQIRQILGGWSSHVGSWTENDEIPVHVIRYEDMLDRPLAVFESAVRFLGLSHEERQIEGALNACSFERLRGLEERSGFRERPPGMDRFFRKGEVGSWRSVLTSDQVARIVADHRETMIKYGYLNESGELEF